MGRRGLGKVGEALLDALYECRLPSLQRARLVCALRCSGGEGHLECYLIGSAMSFGVLSHWQVYVFGTALSFGVVY